ncbi:MAG: hypothetical protein LIR50_20305, partial [Bacillota bacterium]|nr:hypothetical protein [Bacillota bacterium]
GIAVFFIPFASGLIGAGDVKLMAAIGVLKGFMFTVMATLFSSAAGLIVVIGYLIYKKKIFSYFRKYFIGLVRYILFNINFSNESNLGNKLKKFAYSNSEFTGANEKLYVPYGLAIALGTLFTLWWNYSTYLHL